MNTVVNAHSAPIGFDAFSKLVDLVIELESVELSIKPKPKKQAGMLKTFTEV